MGRKRIAVSRDVNAALELLGHQIRLGRHRLHWTQNDLAWRIGASAGTVAAIEKGSPAASVGLVFAAASKVGVPLLAEDASQVRRSLAAVDSLLAVMPQRVRSVGPLEGNDGDDSYDF